MKKDKEIKEKNYAAKGMAAGAVLATVPTAVNAAAAVITKPKNNCDFISVKDGKLVTNGENEILLHGMNFNEIPFICHKNGEDFSGDTKELFSALSSRFGVYGAREVFNRFYYSSFTAKDIKSAAKLGFNAVVIPLKSYLLTTDIKNKKRGLSLSKLDKLISACGKNGIYVILSLEGFAEEIPENIIKYWEKLSLHYKNEPAIAAYKILENIPVGTDTDTLDKIYKDAVKIIRKNKDNHVIILENRELKGTEVVTKHNDKNLALGFSGRLPTVFQMNDTLAEIKDTVAMGVPVIVTEFFPADYGKAFDELLPMGVSCMIGSFKGDIFCLYCGDMASIDIEKDSFEEINKALTDKAKAKDQYKENTQMKEMLAKITDFIGN